MKQASLRFGLLILACALCAAAAWGRPANRITPLPDSTTVESTRPAPPSFVVALAQTDILEANLRAALRAYKFLAGRDAEDFVDLNSFQLVFLSPLATQRPHPAAEVAESLEVWGDAHVEWTATHCILRVPYAISLTKSKELRRRIPFPVVDELAVRSAGYPNELLEILQSSPDLDDQRLGVFLETTAAILETRSWIDPTGELEYRQFLETCWLEPLNHASCIDCSHILPGPPGAEVRIGQSMTDVEYRVYSSARSWPLMWTPMQEKNPPVPSWSAHLPLTRLWFMATLGSNSAQEVVETL